jgi:hypothetical protein
MKKIKLAHTVIFAVLLGLVSTFSSYASSPAAISAKSIRQKFINAVVNPDDPSIVPTTGEVEVTFKLTDEGTVDIKKITGTSDEAQTYVKDRITQVPCKDFVHPYNQYYKIKFRFSQD